MCAKNYQNREKFGKDIAKIKRCSFFTSHGIYTVHRTRNRKWTAVYVGSLAASYERANEN